MKFEDAYKLVGIAEGGYSNHSNDKGGETICGISRVAHPNSSIWKMIDRWKERGNTSASSLTKLAKNDPHFMNLVKGIYRGNYWDSCRCEELPNLWRYPVFSCAVNCGSKVAIKLLQEIVGTKADGIYGGKTTLKVRTYEETEQFFVHLFCESWYSYYEKIVNKKPSQKVFFNGWINRIKNVKKENF